MPNVSKNAASKVATAPRETYSIAEIVKLTRVSRRNLGNWVRRGLIPSPQFRGSRTRWGRHHLVRILAVKKMRGDFHPLEAIRLHLDKLTTDELERFAGVPQASAPPAPARPAPPAPPAARPLDAASFGAITPSYQGDRWERIVLLPGLELHVCDEPLLRRVAQLVFDQFHGP